MVILAGAAAASGAASQPGPAAPAAAPASAEAAATSEALARRLIEVIGAGDEARARSFFEESFSPESARFEPRERTLTRLLALTRQSGGIDIEELEREGDQLFLKGRTRRGALAVQGMIGVRAGRIMGFELQRDPTVRGPGAPAWPPAATTPGEAVAAIAREIDWRAQAGRFSGAVLIAHRGRPVLERAWGLARRGPDVAATPQTMFTTASSTKMLTSAAIGRLIDQGRLSLDTTVAAAVPALASAPGADRATIRDLLGHRVSYGEYFSETEQDPLIATHSRATELLPLLRGRAPEPAPAGRIAYSNANYLVLAAAIEAGSGRSFYDYVEGEILRPLRMEHTSYGGGQARPRNLALGWIKDEVEDPLGIGEWRSNEGRNGGSRGGPAGGAWSTAGDMWRFLDAVAAGRVIRPQTLQAMWGDRRRVSRNLGAAVGFMFRGGGEQPSFFGHSGGGGNAGVSSSVFITPDREWAVVVLSNFSSPAGEMLGGQVMDYLASLPRTERAEGARGEGP
jgi:CubicO group peptidase (beta-lactamase class C family)